MRCEMCGKDVPYLKTVLIEGTVLRVCEECAKYGEEVGEKEARKYAPARGSIAEGLAMREKRMREKDILDTEEALVPDFADVIRRTRQKMGISQEELAKKINEKKSVIGKIESGELIPNEELRKKLERSLNIHLTAKVEAVHPAQKKGGKRRGLTLGDLIRIED